MIKENQIVEVFTLVDDFILGLNYKQSKLTSCKHFLKKLKIKEQY